MVLTTALSIATSGLRATNQEMSVVSSNIANARTEGYTKKTTNREDIVVNGRLPLSLIRPFSGRSTCLPRSNIGRRPAPTIIPRRSATIWGKWISCSVNPAVPMRLMPWSTILPVRCKGLADDP